MILAPPLFPARSFVDDAVRRRAEETPLGGTAARIPRRHGTIYALETWVRGGTFHPYGTPALAVLVADVGVEDAVREMRRWKGELKIEGEVIDYLGLGMRWSVFFRRAGGNPDESGGCAGFSAPEDAAYQCLSLIEEGEREAYLEQLVVGVA